MRLILASASPRRRELLSLLKRDFSCQAMDVDESVLGGELPANYVRRLARAKAMACDDPEALILAADTTVVLGGEILGKPRDAEHARQMLSALSGQTHEVLTALCLRQGKTLREVLVQTTVSFAELSADTIAAYLATDEPWDKAGAYGIQGMAGSFVRAITGSYSAVVGLPLAEARELLADFGLQPDWSENGHG